MLDEDEDEADPNAPKEPELAEGKEDGDKKPEPKKIGLGKGKFTEIVAIQEMEQENFYDSDEKSQEDEFDHLKTEPWEDKIKPFNAIKFLVTSLRR